MAVSSRICDTIPRLFFRNALRRIKLADALADFQQMLGNFPVLATPALRKAASCNVFLSGPFVAQSSWR